MAREFFCAYHSYLNAMRKLSDAECGRLFRALLSYSAGEQLIKLQGREEVLFDVFADQIDRDNAKYEAKCRKNRENGAMANGTGRRRTVPNAPQEKDKDKEEEKGEIKKESKKKKSFSPPSFDEVEAYCKERNSNVDPKRFFDYYNAGGWNDNKGNSVKNWKQKLITWETRNDRGESNAGKPIEKSPSGGTAEASKQKYGNYI